MDEKKNNEMSVDELLEKLRASLQTDDVKVSHSDTDDDIKKVIAAAIGSDDTAESKAAEIEAEDATVADDAKDDVIAETEAEVEEPVTDSAVGQANNEDIYAAWGIEQPENPSTAVEAQQETEPVEESAEPVVAHKKKVYYIVRVERKEDYNARKNPTGQKRPVDYDRVDYSLIKQALGMEKPTDADGFPMFDVEDNSTLKSIETPHAEFTYQRQRDEFSAGYVKNSRFAGLKLFFTAVFALLLFAIECLPAFGLKLPEILDVNSYPIIYAMAKLQLVWLCGAFSYKEIANGFLNLGHFKITSGGMLSILVLSNTVCSAVACAMESNVAMYHFSVAFLALAVRIFDYFDIRREMLAFEVASSTQSKKYVALPVSRESVAKIKGLEDYTGDDSLVLRTEKCTFVENYFARTEKRSERDIVTNKYVVPFMVIVAIASLVILFANGANVPSALGAFNLALAVSLPALALLSSAYPLYKATKKLYKKESAIIGEKAVDDYSGTTMICFDDADAFPSYGVALENLRIYGSGDIETIIEQMGAVFSKLGGPLKNVFALMTSDCPRPYKVKIDSVDQNGIKAIVDGKVLYVGNIAYMLEKGFSVADRSSNIGGKQFSTMYLAEEEGLRAKFFIRYTLDGGFETIVKKLARRGISSVILTGDSNINDELLSQSLDITKLPVKVVRRQEFEGVLPGDRADSGVVSRGGVGDLVGTITMCDRLAGVLGTIRAVRIASAVICAMLAIAVSLLKMTGAISSLYVLIYHLFWLIPTWLIAKINL